MILEKIDQDLLALAKQSDNDLKDIYAQVDELCLVNSNKVLSAFIENQVSYSDFTDINGYGNYDEGRDKLERIFASILGCEDALVRPQILSLIHISSYKSLNICKCSSIFLCSSFISFSKSSIRCV